MGEVPLNDRIASMMREAARYFDAPQGRKAVLFTEGV